MANPLSNALDAQFSDLKNQNIAVAVSGGPDSMALCHALNAWSGGSVHALIVDHGLRTESATEAQGVRAGLSNVCAHILTWDEKPGAGIQERAREARYSLMSDYMRTHSLQYLFLGHHMDDQAETFLFRLAKGSGVDGLACMQPRQEQAGVILCRPFLGLKKIDLISYCDVHGLEVVCDPSNDSNAFARVRLRQSMDVLSEEGLTVERLAKSARRFSNVRDALGHVTEKTYKLCVSKKEQSRIEFNYNVLMEQPYEIVLRCLLLGIAELSDHAIRLQRVEVLCDALFSDVLFRKRTLAGCVFERQSDVFVITKM